MFVGRLAVLEDEKNPDWVPCKTLNIEQGKFEKKKVISRDLNDLQTG